MARKTEFQKFCQHEDRMSRFDPKTVARLEAEDAAAEKYAQVLEEALEMGLSVDTAAEIAFAETKE